MATRRAGSGEPSSSLVSVVMPAHNEESYLSEAVTTVLTWMAEHHRPVEVLVCENGSVDATATIARRLVAAHPQVRLVSLAEADYGRALRAGFLEARGEVVVNFDVDLVDLGFLEQAIAIAGEGEADVVIGSKRDPASSDDRPLGRRLVTDVFGLLLRYGFGLRASDTHGLKLLRKSSTEALVEACRSGSDIFDTELVLRAERAERRVVEIPVHIVEQRPARTSIIGRIPRTLLGLLRLRLLLWGEVPPTQSRRLRSVVSSESRQRAKGA